MKVDDGQSLSTWLGLSLFGDVVELVAALLAIAVVRQIQRRANARADAGALTLGPSVAPGLSADAT